MDPILISLGPLEIRYYGLMYVTAIFVGAYFIATEMNRRGMEKTYDDVLNFVVWTVFAGILGARIYYVVFNWDYYSVYPEDILAIWKGGLAIHGGLIGALIYGYFYVKKNNFDYLELADISMPAVILGQAFGRFGNFMNGDAHGVPTDKPWGIVFPLESIAGREFPGLPLHPVMLYELAINFLIFCFLWFVIRKKNYKKGFTFALYFVLYSLGRGFVESFRADSLMMGPLRAAQMVSIAAIAIAGFFIFKYKLYEKQDHSEKE